MLYMVTFTINIPPMLAYMHTSTMDPMGNQSISKLQKNAVVRKWPLLPRLHFFPKDTQHFLHLVDAFESTSNGPTATAVEKWGKAGDNCRKTQKNHGFLPGQWLENHGTPRNNGFSPPNREDCCKIMENWTKIHHKKNNAYYIYIYIFFFSTWLIEESTAAKLEFNDCADGPCTAEGKRKRKLSGEIGACTRPKVVDNHTLGLPHEIFGRFQGLINFALSQGPYKTAC